MEMLTSNFPTEYQDFNACRGLQGWRRWRAQVLCIVPAFEGCCVLEQVRGELGLPNSWKSLQQRRDTGNGASKSESVADR